MSDLDPVYDGEIPQREIDMINEGINPVTGKRDLSNKEDDDMRELFVNEDAGTRVIGDDFIQHEIEPKDELVQSVTDSLFIIRGYEVMLDESVAVFLNKQLKSINEKFKSNILPFIKDSKDKNKGKDSFSFILSDKEEQSLQSRISTAKKGTRGGRTNNHSVYTKKCINMLVSAFTGKEMRRIEIDMANVFESLEEEHKLLLENKYNNIKLIANTSDLNNAKALAFDKLFSKHGMIRVALVAKMLGYGPREVSDYIKDNYTFVDKGSMIQPYSVEVKYGYFRMVLDEDEDGHYQTRVFVTSTGVIHLLRVLPKVFGISKSALNKEEIDKMILDEMLENGEEEIKSLLDSLTVTKVSKEDRMSYTAMLCIPAINKQNKEN